MGKAAKRQRAYRERMRRGRVVIRLELDAGTIEKLEVVYPELTAVDVDDPRYRTLLAAAAQDLLAN